MCLKLGLSLPLWDLGPPRKRKVDVHNPDANPEFTPSPSTRTHTKVTVHQKWVSRCERKLKWAVRQTVPCVSVIVKGFQPHSCTSVRAECRKNRVSCAGGHGLNQGSPYSPVYKSHPSIRRTPKQALVLGSSSENSYPCVRRTPTFDT